MSNVLNITPAAAIKAYNNADKKGRELLENLFTKQIFSQDITERIKTFEDVCAEAGVDPADYTKPFDKLELIYEVFNGDWVADYSDVNQVKYYPFFRYEAGSGFSYDYCGCDRAGTCVGARLSTKSKELAIYIGKTFKKEYNDFLSPKQK